MLNLMIVSNNMSVPDLDANLAQAATHRPRAREERTHTHTGVSPAAAEQIPLRAQSAGNSLKTWQHPLTLKATTTTRCVHGCLPPLPPTLKQHSFGVTRPSAHSASPPTHTQTAFFWCDASVRALGCAQVICDTEPDRVAVALLLLQRDRKSVYGKVQMTRLVHICLCGVPTLLSLSSTATRDVRRIEERERVCGVCVVCMSELSCWAASNEPPFTLD